MLPVRARGLYFGSQSFDAIEAYAEVRENLHSVDPRLITSLLQEVF